MCLFRSIHCPVLAAVRSFLAGCWYDYSIQCVCLLVYLTTLSTIAYSQAGSHPSVLWEAKFESTSCPGLHTVQGFETQGPTQGCNAESKAATRAPYGSSIEIVGNSEVSIPPFDGESSVRFRFNREDYVQTNKHLQLNAWPDHLGGRDPSRDILAPVCGKQGCDSRWYTLSIYVPNEWVWDDAGLIVMQLHEVPDKSCGEQFRSPPFALSISNQQWDVSSYWTENACDKGPGHPSTHNRNNLTYLADKAIQRGQWTTFVINARWDYRQNSNGGQGFMKIWKNGERFIDHNGPNFYNDNTAGRWMFGMYSHKPAGQCPPQTTCWDESIAQKVLYFDNWVVGDERIDSYEAFATLAGLNNDPTPRPEEPVSIQGCPTEAMTLGSSTILRTEVADVRWTTSNAAVASVNDQGVVRALSEGNALITATTASSTDNCQVTVSSSSDCQGSNVALGGAIMSSSGQQEGNPASHLLDGVSDTDANRWSVKGYPQWVIVDLGSEQPIGGSVVHSVAGRDYEYEVYASSSVSEVASKSEASLVGQGVANEPLSIQDVSARYVRLEMTGAGTYQGSWVSVREWEVLSSCADSTTSVGVSVLPSGPTGVTTLSGVRLYPNPAAGRVVIRGPAHYGVQVYDLEGRRLQQSGALSGRTSLDTSSLRPGVYVVQLTDTDTGQTHQQRLVVE